MNVVKPNIILFLTDHFRHDALGNNTENLIQLANSGINYVNSYCASPLCQPSRNSIITGLLPHQNSILGNQNRPLNKALREKTFMNLLKLNGYYNILIGKHHFIDRFGLNVDICKDDFKIKKYGFEYVKQVVDDGENLYNDDEYTKYLLSQNKLIKFRNELKKRNQFTNKWANNDKTDVFLHPFDSDNTVDGFIGNSTLDFLDSYDFKKPFYLNTSFVGPHPPLWHPGKSSNSLDNLMYPIGVKENTDDILLKRSHYLAKCKLIDFYIGEIVEKLKEKNIFNKTVIIFTSDHGDNLGDFNIWDKRYFYENSVKVPFFILGPNIPHGKRLNGPLISKRLISHLDIYPTILYLSQTKNKFINRIGYNLFSKNKYFIRNHVLSEIGTQTMIRTANWKLVFDPEQDGVQYLYNLITDKYELDNLAGKPEYESICYKLITKILSIRILLTQKTHVKEETRLQRVKI